MVSFGGVAIGEIGFAADLVVGGSGRVYVMDDASFSAYKSEDGGATWADVLIPVLDGSGRCFDVLAGAGGADTIYHDGFVGLDDNHIAKSTDGGATWTLVTRPVFAGGRLVQNVSMVDASTVYLEAGGSSPDHVWRTTNGGTSWAQVTVADHQSPVMAGTAKIWSASSASTGAIKRYLLDGTGAETLTTGGTADDAVGAAMPSRGSDTFALFYRGVLGISDATKLWKCVGTTVTDITPPGSNVTAFASGWMAAYSPDGSRIVALCYDPDGSSGDLGQLWLSTNGGTSWTKVEESTNLKPTDVPTAHYLIACDPNDSQVWYVAGGNLNNNDAVVWRSTDGGATWASTAMPSGVTNLICLRAASG